ncbi:MAG TPA: helix-turn-helix domain-containing protein [Balneolaceae bacterium]
MYLYQRQQRIQELLKIYKNKLPEPNVNHPALIQKAVGFIYKHLFDQRLTIQWLKQQFLFDGVPFSLSFRRYMDKTPNEFWAEHRMEAAIVLLKDDALEEAMIGNISFNVGYSSHSAFSIAFKKYTGYSPRTFRKNDIDLSKEKKLKKESAKRETISVYERTIILRMMN